LNYRDSKSFGTLAIHRQLLRNGASHIEARELARHSDIRMTTRYTHIGLDDQARVVAAIPGPRRPINPTQNPGSTLGVKPAANLSFAVIGWQHGDHGTDHY